MEGSLPEPGTRERELLEADARKLGIPIGRFNVLALATLHYMVQAPDAKFCLADIMAQLESVEAAHSQLEVTKACPRCGVTLVAGLSSCPSCGHELRRSIWSYLRFWE